MFEELLKSYGEAVALLLQGCASSYNTYVKREQYADDVDPVEVFGTSKREEMLKAIFLIAQAITEDDEKEAEEYLRTARALISRK